MSGLAQAQHHRRSPSSTSKKSTAKSGRPALPKTHNANRLHKPAKAKSASCITFTEEEIDMVTSFHQFCTTCEKQIAVPNNAYLYCSESCRRRDAQYSDSGSCTSPTGNAAGCNKGNANNVNGAGCGAQTSPSTVLSEYEAFLGRPLISKRKPSNASVPAVQHDGKADMDPTEWKPDSKSAPSDAPNGGGSTAPTSAFNDNTAMKKASENAANPAGRVQARARSDAYLYLAQFHRSTENFAELSASSGSRRHVLRKPDAGVSSAGSSFDRASTGTDGSGASSTGNSISSSSSSSSNSSSSNDGDSSCDEEEEDTIISSIVGTQNTAKNALVPKIRVSSVDDNMAEVSKDEDRDIGHVTYPKKDLTVSNITEITTSGIGRLLANKPKGEAGVVRFRAMPW